MKYTAFENHRTASPGDIATSEWLASELNKAGFKAEVRSWKLKQFFLSGCDLKVDGASVESFPGWYPNAAPVTAALAVYDDGDTGNLKGKIAYAGPKYGAISNTGGIKLVEKIRDAGAVGLVVACHGTADNGLLVAANAEMKSTGPEYYQAALPIPVALVATNDDARLAAAAQAGKSASITVTGETREVTANNVVGILKGGDKWVIVTTPISGWFKCGGERGTGVALFLGLARWIGMNSHKYSYIFIGNSGHELAYVGSHFAPDEYLPAYNINKDNVACWFHLGASIACRSWQKDGANFKPLDVPNDAYFLAASSFVGVKGLYMGTGTYAGELVNIVKWGYTACGFFGSNYFFHTRMDTEQETSPALLEPVGDGLIKFFTALEAGK
ncbi:MAG: hypothetical protein NTV42_00910 [Chloroflexi bacterium]|nr:hypothetical protein [Chloroflexota bacterium]